MRAPTMQARALLLSLLATLSFSIFAIGCGKEKAAPNLCDNQVAGALQPPLTDAEQARRRAVCPAIQAELGSPADARQCEPGSSILTCPAGAHCNENGRCELACVADTVDRCGGGTCTAEGRCVERGWLWVILDFPATKWVVLILLLVMPLASILTWMERRQSAMMQDRLGPNRANIGRVKLKGILHFVADALKMIFKEDFIPANVHKGLFALAPILAIAPVFIAFAIIPFGPTIYPHVFTDVADSSLMAQNADAYRDAIRLQIWRVDFGLIFYFAILTLANYGGTIAGWASYNKWALLGGLRSSSQMMSYEVSMGLSLMGTFLVVGSLEPGFIVEHGAVSTMSAANPANWLWLWQPVGLVLFFTAAIAETKRAPFDIPEGEPEIIGYFVEYSGLRWGLFFLAEFVEIVFISAVITTVFFGGYHVPYLEPDGFHAFGQALRLPHGVVVLLQIGAFGAKTFLLCWFQLMIRWTLPRFRADQLMNLGWKILLPLSLANVLVTALIKLLTLN
ncbi:MAG TPA: complex I subunit 1 family protein [Kofleriaceae bacterium]|nr:complex I subunit 1 family protein [Kofleriaceae bacterium]